MDRRKFLLLAAISPLCLWGCKNADINPNKPITIWVWDTLAISARKAVEIYKTAHPDISYDFEVVELGQDDMVKKIRAGLASGSLDTLPNIFYEEDYNFAEYLTYYDSFFMDLSSYINLHDYLGYKTVNSSFNNKVYSLPYDGGIGSLFYRTDILNKAGVTDKDLENLTWDQYVSIGKRVKDSTGIDLLPIAPESDMEGRLLYQSAGTWFTDDLGHATIKGNQAFKDAHSTIKNAFQAGVVYKASSWDDIIASISNEKIASLVGASWWMPIIKSYKNQSGLWRLTKMPRMVGNKTYSNYSNLGGGGWFVLNQPNKEVAANFITETFGSSVDLANYMIEQAAYVPTNKKIISEIVDNGDSFFGNQRLVATLSEYSANVIPVRYGLNSYEIDNYVGQYAAEYYDNQISLDEAINRMQYSAENIVRM